MRASAIPLYELADAARAAGCTADRLASWVSRGNVTPALPATGSGGRHRFSRDDVIRLAIGTRLWNLGLCPSEAFGLAGAWVEDCRGREPGELYPNGKTLLVAVGDRDAAVMEAATVAPTDDRAMIVLDIGKVIAAVEPRLVERRFVPFSAFTVSHAQTTSLSPDEQREAVDRFVAASGAA